MQKAQSTLHGLLELSNHYLSKQTMSHGEEPGNPRETLMLMVQFITNEVENNRLGLPDILTAERDVTSPKAIYKEDYAKLPQDVKEKFEQVDCLIALANQAANEEQCEIGKHEKLINEIDDVDLERQYAKEKERLKENCWFHSHCS